MRGAAVLSVLLLAGAGVQDKGARVYNVSDEDFTNPERGLMVFVNFARERDLSWLKSKGVSLVFVGVSLAPYRGGAIDAAFLGRLSDGFKMLRASGLKAVLRFNYSSTLGDADAPKKIVLQHIEQLRPILHENADVLSVLQAGFIGAWGEWHGSTNGLDDPVHRKDVLSALLQALPPGRPLQLRTPHFKQKLLGGGPLQESEAFKDHFRARVGHHNDAFFADANDMGTYDDPVRKWKDWLAQDGRFVPVGGETTAGPPRADGAEFVAELERLHWSFLHWRYPDDLRKKWEEQGHFGRIRRRLGYRFELIEASWTPVVRPGGEIKLTVRLRNGGFAAPYNRRPAYVVLAMGDTRVAARLTSVDPREWEGGREEKFTVKVAVPSSQRRGKYTLALWLPDEAPSLAARPECAIRFANEGVWDAAAGHNVLGDVRIDPNGPGLYNSRIKEFVEVQ